LLFSFHCFLNYYSTNAAVHLKRRIERCYLLSKEN
jgi:hypothetical protein